MTPSAVALIVGAGDGLGGAIARRFARAGYHVCIARRGAEKLEPLRREIESAGGAVTAVGVDARKEDEVIALFDSIERDNICRRLSDQPGQARLTFGPPYRLGQR